MIEDSLNLNFFHRETSQLLADLIQVLEFSSESAVLPVNMRLYEMLVFFSSP